MQSSIFPGMTSMHTLEVDDSAVANPLRAGAVVPTTLAVAFVEWACGEAVRPYLDAGERSVGTRIVLEHDAARLVGPRITAQVELIEICGRTLRFKVVAQDALKVIGRGVLERLVIDDSEDAARRGDDFVTGWADGGMAEART
jgi:fluoroacetyl-CoA thioesterase